MRRTAVRHPGLQGAEEAVDAFARSAGYGVTAADVTRVRRSAGFHGGCPGRLLCRCQIKLVQDDNGGDFVRLL